MGKRLKLYLTPQYWDILLFEELNMIAARLYTNKPYPIIYENSSIPKIVSWITPINPYAISFFVFVFCSGLLNKKTLRHETIHYLQQKEMLFIGQWFLYAFYYLSGLLKYRDAWIAYRMNPFEREAYENDENINYLDSRRRFAWKNYRD